MRGRYAFLLTPTWLGWLVACAAFAVGTFFLGQWQMDRRELALEEIDRVIQNYDQDPVPYSEVRDLFHAPEQDDEWTVVQLQGEYLEEDSLLARNRGHGGQVGYEQLVPLRDSTTGDVLIVSRGWLPTDSEGAGRPAYNPAPPGGQVDVTARLKPAEAETGRGAPEGQLASIEPEQYQDAVDYPLVAGAYALMAEESPEPAERPHQLARPALDEGPHLSYSMQWIAFGLMGFVGWGYAARLHARSRDIDAMAGEELSAEGAGTAPAARQERVRAARRQNRRSKGKYSDEDAEDAWVDERLRLR